MVSSFNTSGFVIFLTVASYVMFIIRLLIEKRDVVFISNRRKKLLIKELNIAIIIYCVVSILLII